jgi:hypothetical protein
MEGKENLLLHHDAEANSSCSQKLHMYIDVLALYRAPSLQMAVTTYTDAA